MWATWPDIRKCCSNSCSSLPWSQHVIKQQHCIVNVALKLLYAKLNKRWIVLESKKNTPLEVPSSSFPPNWMVPSLLRHYLRSPFTSWTKVMAQKWCSQRNRGVSSVLLGHKLGIHCSVLIAVAVYHGVTMLKKKTVVKLALKRLYAKQNKYNYFWNNVYWVQYTDDMILLRYFFRPMNNHFEFTHSVFMWTYFFIKCCNFTDKSVLMYDHHTKKM